MSSSAQERSTSRVLFRIKAGLEYGWGHLVRATAIASHLVNSSWAVDVKIAAEGDRRVAAALLDSELPFVVLPPWGSPEAVNAEIEMLASCQPDATIFDMLHIPDSLHQHHKAACHATIVFDDTGQSTVPADTAIRPQLLPPTPETSARRLIEGTKYFVVADSILRCARTPDANKESGSSLLICTGGCVTGSTLVAIADIVERLQGARLSIEILTGFDQGGDDSLYDRLSALGARCIPGVSDIGPYLARADMALASSGFLKYELAAAGVPTLLVSIVEHQESLGQEFARRTGSAKYIGRLGTIEPQKVAQAVMGLMGDVTARRGMTESGRELIDGGALERLAAEIRLLTGRGEAAPNVT